MATYSYNYHEERGIFQAYVENKDGVEIWRVEYPDYYEEDGEMFAYPTIFDDGYMKNAQDVAGLQKYLHSLGLIGKHDKIVEGDLVDDDAYAEGGKVKVGDMGTQTAYMVKVAADIVAAYYLNDKGPEFSTFEKYAAYYTSMSGFIAAATNTHYRDNAAFRKAVGKGSQEGRRRLYAYMHTIAKQYLKAEPTNAAADDTHGKLSLSDTSYAILEKLGGMKKLTVRLGAHSFSGVKDGLVFRIENKKVNYIKIVEEAPRLYFVEFGRVVDTYKVVKSVHGLSSDDFRWIISDVTNTVFAAGGILGNPINDFRFDITSPAFADGGMLGNPINDARFDITSPSFKTGGKVNSEEFIKDLRALKNQVYMIQLQNGELIPGSKIKFEQGGKAAPPVYDINKFLQYFYVHVAEQAKELGLSLRSDYSISDGGNQYYEPHPLFMNAAGHLQMVGISYLSPAENTFGEIIIDIDTENIVFDFPEWGIEAPHEYKEGGQIQHDLAWFKEVPSYLDRERSVDDLAFITQPRIDKMRAAGLTDEDIKAIIYGYQFINPKIKADVEFLNYATGLVTLNDDYVDKVINEILKNVKAEHFEAGLKYPDFKNWEKVFKKYGIPTTPTEVITESLYEGKKHYENQYAVWHTKGIVVSKQVGTKRYVDGKLDRNEMSSVTRASLEGAPYGYAGIVCRSITVLNSLLKDFFSDKNNYCKDIDYLYNHLGGMDGVEVKKAGVKFKLGGVTDPAMTRTILKPEDLDEQMLPKFARGGTTGNYEVELKAVPNYDHDENSHAGTVRIAAHRVKVNDITDARAAVLDFIEENDLGGGNFVPASLYLDGKKIGYISYNGRVWESEKKEMTYADGGATPVKVTTRRRGRKPKELDPKTTMLLKKYGKGGGAGGNPDTKQTKVTAKDWAVIYITNQGKQGVMNFRLGRLSDKNDAKQQIKRQSPGNIMEVISIESTDVYS